MSSVSRRVKKRPMTYVPPVPKSINPVVFVSEPITAPPQLGGNLKAIGRAIKKGVKPVARVVRKTAKPLGSAAGELADLAGMVPDPRAQALSRGLRVAQKSAPVVERVAKMAGGRRRIPAAVGTVAVGGGMKGKRAILRKL
jgi:hypothetical protein